MKKTLSFILILLVIAGGLVVYKANAAENKKVEYGVVCSADKTEYIGKKGFLRNNGVSESDCPQSVTMRKNKAISAAHRHAKYNGFRIVKK